MVRVFILLIFAFTLLFGDSLENSVKNLVSEDVYQKHYRLINKIFQNREDFYLTDEKVDILKVIKTLKENGLLNLFFESPKENIITFKTNSNPIFFMKIIQDNLNNLGFMFTFTKEIDFNDNLFIWKIKFDSEYTLDPEMFSSFLIKNGCDILEISRKSESKWEYFINVDRAYLNVKKLVLKERTRLKKPLSDYWLNISGGSKISIASYGGNRWYPKIVIYDKNLHILKVYKKDEKTDWLVIYLPPSSYYIKISDSYTLNNLKYGLRVTLE